MQGALGGPGGCCGPALGHTKVAGGTAAEGRYCALLWGREWGRRWGGMELGGGGCCTHIPLSPSAALSHNFTGAHPCQQERRDGGGWPAVPPGWYLPQGSSQSGTRDKGSQPLSQPASTCYGYIPIPAALEGQRPWGEASCVSSLGIGTPGSASLRRASLGPPAESGEPGSGVPRAKGETLPPWNSLPSAALQPCREAEVRDGRAGSMGVPQD